MTRLLDDPALLGAVLFMVALAVIPRRRWYIQLPAVLGWALVWLDNDFAGRWPDLVGLTVVMASLGTLIVLERHDSSTDH